MARANATAPRAPGPRVLGRYLVFDEIGSGGMASVHLARHVGPLGFRRTVAIKRLHPQLAKDSEFVAMFIDEARLAARVQHPNVVATIDVVTAPDELILVMEYIHGETLSRLARTPDGGVARLEPAVASAIVSDALYGLHAAHEARDEQNQPLSIVHRDVSPQNLLVGVDGVTRMLDFGIAKASTRSAVTRDGQVKGKLAYMAPEQLRGRPVDRRADVFAASVVLWELLTGERLFQFDDVGAAMHQILSAPTRAPSTTGAPLPAGLDQLVLRGLARDPADRFASAREMAAALEAACAPASAAVVGRWVESLAGPALSARLEQVAALERVPPEVAEREVTEAGAGSRMRSVLREIAERDERAEAATDVGLSEAAPPPPAVRAVVAPRAEPGRGAPRWAVALGATLVGAAAAVALMRASRSETDRPPVSSPTAESASAADHAAPPDTDAPAPDDPLPSGSAVAVAASPVGRRPPPAASSRVPTAAPARSAADCSPPYYFEDGIKRYKPHCFGPR